MHSSAGTPSPSTYIHDVEHTLNSTLYPLQIGYTSSLEATRGDLVVAGPPVPLPEQAHQAILTETEPQLRFLPSICETTAHAQ